MLILYVLVTQIYLFISTFLTPMVKTLQIKTTYVFIPYIYLHLWCIEKFIYFLNAYFLFSNFISFVIKALFVVTSRYTYLLKYFLNTYRQNFLLTFIVIILFETQKSLVFYGFHTYFDLHYAYDYKEAILYFFKLISVYLEKLVILYFSNMFSKALLKVTNHHLCINFFNDEKCLKIF